MHRDINVEELARTGVAHLSMIRQIQAGKYKAKPADLESRLTWLKTNYSFLRDGDALCNQVADEIDRVLSQSAEKPLSSQPEKEVA